MCDERLCVMCRMEAVLVVPQPDDDPSIIFSACADGYVLRWELDTDLNADSFKWGTPCLSLCFLAGCIWPLCQSACLHAQT